MESYRIISPELGTLTGYSDRGPVFGKQKGGKPVLYSELERACSHAMLCRRMGYSVRILDGNGKEVG